MVVSWFSAGVSSAVATKIALSKYPEMKIIYTHIDDQHPDTLRFLKDCEKWFDHEIEINQSPLKSVNNACLKSAFMKGPHGAACTRLLKKRVRKEWEFDNPGQHVYIWGMDCGERDRVERIINAELNHTHVFPLIGLNYDKEHVHGVIEKAGIKRPVMYDLGYSNNNCIGCLKASAGYWNAIKRDFPDVFESRCLLEETIGATILKEYSLRDLPEDKGRKLKIIVPDCGIFCEIKGDE